MLPPGIYMLCSGRDGLAGPVDPEALAAMSPYWAEAVETFGPWAPVDGGSYLRSGRESELTLVVAGECTSTMDLARHLLKEGVLGQWGSVISPSQLSGRGQLRRPWVSSPGNLYASVVWPGPPDHGPWKEQASVLLPILAGYVLADVLSAMGQDVFIKWPNDLLMKDRKVGGLLVEEREGHSILGAGINLSSAPSDEQMRADKAVSAGIFRVRGVCPPALTLWEALVNQSKSVYEILLDTNSSTEFLTRAARRLAWLGREVFIRDGGIDDRRAVVVGFSPDGGLVLRRNRTKFVLRSGSIFPTW